MGLPTLRLNTVALITKGVSMLLPVHSKKYRTSWIETICIFPMQTVFNALLNDFGSIMHIDYIVPLYDFRMGFATPILTRAFANGSKLEKAVDGGIFPQSVGISKSIRLPYYGNFFQAKLCAIQAAMETCSKSDSQTSTTALNFRILNSRRMYRRSKCLNEIYERWLPHNSNIPGNYRA